MIVHESLYNAVWNASQGQSERGKVVAHTLNIKVQCWCVFLFVLGRVVYRWGLKHNNNSHSIMQSQAQSKWSYCDCEYTTHHETCYCCQYRTIDQYRNTSLIVQQDILLLLVATIDPIQPVLADNTRPLKASIITNSWRAQISEAHQLNMVYFVKLRIWILPWLLTSCHLYTLPYHRKDINSLFILSRLR